jgi:D-alanyl-lipoteichoic acid acyltransferase DltB (MBOAT superfamily)
MIFNSPEFLLFLPIVFLLYWFVFKKNVKLQNFFVVVASYFFYGWWDWRFLFLIAITSFCSWASGLQIEKYRASQNTKNAKAVNIGNIVLNLLILGVFKYYNFFIESFFDIFPTLRNDQILISVILPVGISFYTFQALSYTIDVYRAKIEPTKDIIAFFAFVSFFPQLVAGPIERATNLLPQFQHKRTFDYAAAVDGCRQMLWGFFKKMVVADNCAVFVDQVWDDIPSFSGSTLLVAAILFSFQIYCDFSGYSDIAIGCSKLFGIKLKRNFNNPYFSRDIAEFWRHWHISLTTWFRDYIYIPLGGSRTTKAKIVRNTFIIFLVSGFWHGANWTFIIWGAFHALLFLPLILLGKNRKYTDNIASNRSFPTFKELLQILLTFLLATFGWIIFRSDDITQALQFFKGIFNISIISIPMISKCFIFIAIMLIVEWINRNNEHEFQKQSRYRVVRYIIYYTIMLSIVLLSTQQETFIYFQF